MVGENAAGRSLYTSCRQAFGASADPSAAGVPERQQIVE
jgi:hypothetical protein